MGILCLKKDFRLAFMPTVYSSSERKNVKSGDGGVNIHAFFKTAGQSHALGHLGENTFSVAQIQKIFNDRSLEAGFLDLGFHLKGLKLFGHVNVVGPEINPYLLAHGQERIDRKTERPPNRQSFFGDFRIYIVSFPDKLSDKVRGRMVETLDGRAVLLI